MKTVKLVTLLLSGFLFVQLQAQNTSTNTDSNDGKKIVIIKKTIDEDGNEVTEKIIKEGEDAENVFFIDEDGENIEIDIKTMSDDDGETMVWVSKDGKKRKAIKHSQTIEVDNDGAHKSIKIVMDGDGEADVFQWDGEGDIPDDIKKQLQEKGIELDESDDMIRVKKKHKSKMKMMNPNQAFLGVKMAITKEVKNENGVETETTDDSSKIVGIVPNSAAAEAGLQEGDVITAIDDATINNHDDVVTALNQYKKGDKISIAYTRDGKSKKTKATLKGHTGNQSIADDGENTNVEVSVEEDEDGNVTTTTITTVTKNGEEKVTKKVEKTKKGKQ